MIWRCDLVPQYEVFKQEIDSAIQRVLSGGQYVLAREVTAFEKEFGSYLGIKNAIGVANGTDGLILSLKVLGIGSGDEVITSPFTAIPTVSAIIAAGAIPKFVDICPDTFLIDLEQIEKAITPKTKAILPVHIFGNVVDIPRLQDNTKGKIFVVEDACQAHGSELNEAQAGTMGDIGVFSFYPTKNLGGYGDGGAIVTNNEEIAQKIRLMRMYGMTDKDHIIIHGINSRLDEIQATVLKIKLKHLNEMNEKRNKIAQRYREELRRDLFEYQTISKNVYSNYHVFAIRFKENREKFMNYLEKNGIQTNIYYLIPQHLQKANEFLAMKLDSLPVAEKLCHEVIALPMYAELDFEKQDYIISCINKY